MCKPNCRHSLNCDFNDFGSNCDLKNDKFSSLCIPCKQIKREEKEETIRACLKNGQNVLSTMVIAEAPLELVEMIHKEMTDVKEKLLKIEKEINKKHDQYPNRPLKISREWFDY